MGDFRKKYNCRLISRGKSLQGYTLYMGTIISCTGKNIAHDEYNAEKKS